MQPSNPQPNPPTAGDVARDLDRAIAERLGWRNLEPYTYWAEDYFDAYQVATLRGVDPDGREGQLLPFWSDELDAALSLVSAAQPCYFELSYSPDRMNWRAEFAPVDNPTEYNLCHAQTPAEAICLAWLAYTATQATRAAGE